MAKIVDAGSVPVAKRNIAIGSVPADMVAVGTLLLLTVLVSWDRLAGGWALQRLDTITFFIPMYGFLGEQLRSGNIPGWNPHHFSGAPFAGDPEFGWMYFPAMLFFTIFPKVTAFKVLTAFHLGLAGLSMFALGRVIGMGVLGSLAAGIAFEFGSFKELTGCCTVYAQLSAWVPIALIGAELAIRSTTWTPRLNWWILTGIAISQMVTGWFGQGTYYGLLVLGAFIAYRTLVVPPASIRSARGRIASLALHGAAVLTVGFCLVAAGLLPRLDVISHSTLAGGDYSEVAPHVVRSGTWTPQEMAIRVLGIWNSGPAFYVGGATLLLAVLGPFLARRNVFLPFFVLIALSAAILAMPDTPFHDLLYFLPKFELLHGHYPHRIVIMFHLGLAVLAGATVSALPRWRGNILLAVIPTVATCVLITTLYLLDIPLEDIAPMTAISLAIVWLMVTLYGFADLGRVAQLVPVFIACFLFIDPTGWGMPDRYPRERGDGQVQRILDGYTSTTGPAAVLMEQDDEMPARFSGYELGMSGEQRKKSEFHGQYRNPRLIALVINNRALYLDLYDIQGYNPVQVARYNSYVRAMNGDTQEYHESHMLPGAIGSPLLDVLGVRHIVVPAAVPPGRPDLLYLSQLYPTVYADRWTRVLENSGAFPRAWIVHQAEQVFEGEALPLMTSGEVDLRTTAVLETDPPPLEVPADATADEVSVEQYEPDRIQLTARTDSAGLLMLSEIYDPGWKAYVDGNQVDLYVADHAFRAVPLPAGDNDIELRYEPTSMKVGLAITGMTTAGIIGVVAASLAQRIRGHASPPRTFRRVSRRS